MRNTDRLANYEKIDRVGEGTYGVVYKARDLENGDTVAMKRIRFQHEDEGIPSTAIREISLLKTLKHPNIVPLREVIYKEEQLHLIFDFLDMDLKKCLKSVRGPLPQEKVKIYMKQLMEGLAFCHRNRVIHRDLKPHNLLINNDGTLQLADFGLARTFTLPIREYTHEVITLWYRAPEILLGQRVYSTPVDIWSAGCIFAEMITGIPLFPGDSEIDEIFKIFKLCGTPNEETWKGVNDLPDYKTTFPRFKKEDISKFVPNATPEALDLLTKMLVLDPNERAIAEDIIHHNYFTI